MKYHTSPLTIIISILILLVFVAVSSFCVFSLRIGSPSLMILEELEEGYTGSSAFSFRFASVDRNMSEGLIVNDLVLEMENGLEIKVGRAMIYQTPFEIIKQLLFKNGRFEIDVLDVNAYVPRSLISSSSPESASSGSAIDFNQVNTVLSSLEDHSDLFENTFLYDYAFSVNVERLSVEVEDFIRVSDMKMNLSVEQNLVFDSFRFSVPSASYSNPSVSLLVEDFNFIGELQDSYTMTLSAGKTNISGEGFNAELDDFAAALDFDSFRSLDLRHLPLSFSFTSLKGSYQDYSLLLGRTSGMAYGNSLNGTVLSSSLLYGAYSVSLPAVSFSVGEEGDSLSAVLRASSQIRAYDGGVLLASASGTEVSLSYGSALTAVLSSDVLRSDYLSDFTNGLISGIEIDNIRFTLLGQGSGGAIEGSADVMAAAENSFFNRSTTSVSFSASFAGGALEAAELSLPDIDFPLLDADFNASLSLRGDEYSASLGYSDALSLTASGSSDSLDVDLSFFGFPLASFIPLVDEYIPIIRAYIGNETAVSGSLALRLDQLSALHGDVFGSVAISDIRFNEHSFGLASRLDASVSDGLIEVDSLTLTSEFIRASYTGGISLDTFFPEGSFALEMTESGKRLLNVDFSLNQETEYYFNATVPDFASSYFRGSVNWARDNVIISAGTLKSGETLYPFDFTIDMENYRLDLISDGLIVSLDYEEKLDLLVDFDSFMLPPASSTGESSVIDGSISYYFGFAEQVIEAEAPGFTISNISRIASRPTVSLDFIYDSSGFRADNIVMSDSFGRLEGSAVFDRSASAFAFTLGSEADGRLSLSIMKDQGGYSGILSASEIVLDRFGLTGSMLTTRLVGWGSSLSDFSFSGSMSAYPGQSSQSTSNFTADVILDTASLVLQNLSYSNDALSISSPMLFVNISDGHFNGDVDISYEQVNRDRSYPVAASLSLALELGSHNSMVDLIFSLPELIRNSISASVSINNLDIDNSFRISDRLIEADFSTSRVILSGNFITGSYDFESGAVDITVLGNDIIGAHVHGLFTLDLFDIEISDVMFDLGVMNFLYPVPVVTFDKGAYVYGDFLLYGSFQDSHLYGQAYSDGFDMNIWWMDEEYLRVGDTYAVVVDNHATTNKTAVMMINRETGEINRGYAVTEAQLSNANILDFYNVALEIPDGNNVHIWAPIQSQNMQIKADVSGTFNLYSDLRKNYLSGDLVLDNAVMSIGMDPLPAWFDSNMAVNNDFNVVLRNRSSFVMPLGSDPIISAYFEENTSFAFSYDSQDRTIALDGELGFRSGEIYYFEKNFYITEGNLAFSQNAGSRLDPVINLRARLRDFDSNGDKVDIYLVLNNSSLSNISPTFESSPQKDLNEIMSILGEAILPSTAYGDLSLTSVASLLSSGLDVMSRMGLIGASGSSSGNLSSVIRSSLGLDMFSMRSSILRNLIIDNIFYSSAEEFSPIARYLNDTNIYLGKYLSRNFFLQGLIHLEAVKDSERSFLANDLELDVEISLEWQTPLGEITFATSPMNLSLFNVFDSFALSYTNRIRF